MRRPESTCTSCWQPHPPSQERCFGPPAASSPDEGGGTVHAVPPHGSANTPCCDRSPFDLPAADRITVNAAEVTCASAKVIDQIVDRLDAHGLDGGLLPVERTDGEP